MNSIYIYIYTYPLECPVKSHLALLMANIFLLLLVYVKLDFCDPIVNDSWVLRNLGKYRSFSTSTIHCMNVQ